MEALRDVAKQGEVVRRMESAHGEKCVVDGWLSVHTEEGRGVRSGRFGSLIPARMRRAW